MQSDGICFFAEMSSWTARDKDIILDLFCYVLRNQAEGISLAPLSSTLFTFYDSTCDWIGGLISGH